MSEALRLADDLINAFSGQGLCACAAAELRRLHAENEALRATRAELVEALRWYVDTDEVMEMEGNEFWLDGRERARAALAKVEGGK